MDRGGYYSAHLHMHSCFEDTASMEGHMYEAQRVGVDFIWFTDHDSKIGIKKLPVDGFDFEKDDLLVADSKAEINEKIKKIQNKMNSMGVFLDDIRWKQSRNLLDKHVEAFYGWRRLKPENPGASEIGLSKDRAFRGTQCMKIKVSSRKDSREWQSAVMEFSSNGKRHQYSLLSMIKLKIAAFFERDMGVDERVIFEIKMSQHPPEHKNTKLRYVFGDTGGLAEKYVGVIPIKPEADKWKEYFLNLSEDVARFDIGGQDNVLFTFSIIVETRNGASMTCYFDDFEIIARLTGEPVRKRQQELADEIGRKYGVTPVAATEISAAGPHKNCFSTKVPLIDYAGKNYNVTQDEAIKWVVDHGEIFSLNHPFDFWKRIFVNEEDRKQILNKVFKQYSESKCYGASAIEIGFPEGRHNFSFDDYLELWDRLGRCGIFITGYGVSDNHANNADWWDGNNFAAFIYAEEPTEENLIDSIRNGNVYTGDPALFKGTLSFRTAEGCCMGQVIRAGKPEYKLLFEVDSISPGWVIKWVVDGERKKVTRTTGNSCKDEIVLSVSRQIHFIRVEVYNEDGRCVILTNPVYFISGDEVEIPEGRRAKIQL